MQTSAEFHGSDSSCPYQCATVEPFYIQAASWSPDDSTVYIGTTGYHPMALHLGTWQVFEAVKFDSAGDVGHTWLVVPASGEAAGLLRLARAGPAGAVTDEEPRVEDLQQERSQGQVKPVRGEKPP